MKTNIDRIVDIAVAAQKGFREYGLRATIHEIEGIRIVASSAELAVVGRYVDLLIADLKMHKGQSVEQDIENFIERIRS